MIVFFRGWLKNIEKSIENHWLPIFRFVYFKADCIIVLDTSIKEKLVQWGYNKEINHYLRSNGGQAHKDLNNDSQIQAKTIIVQYMKETGPVNELKHLLYGTTGTGKAIIFQDGQALEATWTKEKRQSRTKFTDKSGKELALNRGPVWIEIIPVGSEVKY